MVLIALNDCLDVPLLWVSDSENFPREPSNKIYGSIDRRKLRNWDGGRLVDGQPVVNLKTTGKTCNRS